MLNSLHHILGLEWIVECWVVETVEIIEVVVVEIVEVVAVLKIANIGVVGRNFWHIQ